MYRYKKPTKTTLKVNKGYEGEWMFEKVRRITVNKEPIKDGAPIIHTERKDGVAAGYNIRTDRFEVALDAMTSVQKSHMARREQRHNPKEEAKVIDIQNDKKEGGTQSTPTTDNK